MRDAQAAKAQGEAAGVEKGQKLKIGLFFFISKNKYSFAALKGGFGAAGDAAVTLLAEKSL